MLCICIMVFFTMCSGCTGEKEIQHYDTEQPRGGGTDVVHFIGVWRYGADSNQLTYTFREDGTYAHGSTNGTYGISERILILNGFTTLRYHYEFSDNFHALTLDLDGGETVVYTLTREPWT